MLEGMLVSRVKTKETPFGYDVRHSDDHRTIPSTVERKVQVNRWGAIWLSRSIPEVDRGGYGVLSEREIRFLRSDATKRGKVATIPPIPELD